MPDRDGRDEGNSLEDILPLAEVIDFIYNSKGEHGVRVKDRIRVRALIRLIGKMKDLLERPKEEEEEDFGEHSMSEEDNDSKEACSIMPSDMSDTGSVAWSEYTVKSIVSWKERTSWFFRLTRGKKRSVA